MTRYKWGSVVVGGDDDIEHFSSPEDNNNAKGFDFDTSEPQITPNNTSNRVLEAVLLASDVKTVVGNDNDEEFEIETLTVVDSDEGDEVVRPRLKRLRRGCSLGTVDLGSGSGNVKSTVEFCLVSVVVDDDDIEDFSSPEDNNAKESGKRKQNVSNVTSAPESVITKLQQTTVSKVDS